MSLKRNQNYYLFKTETNCHLGISYPSKNLQPFGKTTAGMRKLFPGDKVVSTETEGKVAALGYVLSIFPNFHTCKELGSNFMNEKVAYH